MRAVSEAEVTYAAYTNGGGQFKLIVLDEYTGDAETVKAELSKHLFALLEANIAAQGANSLQIVDKWIDYSMIEEGRMRARAVVELHRDIATTRDALAQEG